MTRWFVLACVSLPILDLWLLVSLGRVLGAGPVLALVVLTGVVGVSLARRQGLGVARSVRQALELGQVPGPELLEGLLVLLGGLLLVLPGFVTDVFGLLLLSPPVRRGTGRLLLSALDRGRASGAVRVSFVVGSPNQGSPARSPRRPSFGAVDGPVIDVPHRPIDPTDPNPNRD